MAYKTLAQIARKGSIMLLKIGKRYIILENNTSIQDSAGYDNEPEIRIYLGYTVDGIENWIVFRGDEMIALRSYLDSMAVDVMAVYAEKNKPAKTVDEFGIPYCETCNDTGAIAIRGDDTQDCPDCKREGL